MSGRDGKHETETARLRGARLLVCSEQTSGKRFDEAKVKRLTGGDVLTGRFMRGDFFDFTPSHLTWVLSNHLPEVKEGGPSFWRRLRRIPFLHVVPEDKRDSEKHTKLLDAEGPAILGWAIKGAKAVLQNGLTEPESVKAATQDYQTSEDSLALFIQESCDLKLAWNCRTTEFRDHYEKHCAELGVEPLNGKALTQRLTSEYGVKAGKSNGCRIYKGITLLDEDDGEDRY
jgi:putative DNA primase/helicase